MVLDKFKLFVASAERTHYAQELVDQMARVDRLSKNTKQLIERIRCNAQPNKSSRSEDSLVPDEDESNERLRYAAALREMTTGLSQASLIAYVKNLADIHDALDKQHGKFLKQVQAYCVKELRKFTDNTYSTIKQAYNELDKKRDAYDLARHKLKSCKPEDVDKKGDDAKVAMKEFEQQAQILFEMLQKMPSHEMALAKALYIYTRAETDYGRETNEHLRKIPSPSGSSSTSSQKSEK